MWGTVVNAVTVVAGGLVGLALKKGMKPELEAALYKALGLATLILGLNGVIGSMFTVTAEGRLSSSGELLLILSLALGALMGELLQIDRRMNALSEKLGRRFGGAGFAASFLNGTLLFCVGAMTILGAFNEGLYGDAGVLYLKSVLDGVASVVFGATLGVGVCFAALPILLYEGGLTLLAGLLAPYLQGQLLDEICMVGYVMVMGIGLNFLFDNLKLKTANLLPALLVPVAWAVIRGQF